jgi:hypothetical protein
MSTTKVPVTPYYISSPISMGYNICLTLIERFWELQRTPNWVILLIISRIKKRYKTTNNNPTGVS